ncbi:uncharacterized protein PSFLO_01833 [Pseudozyma flocculosa]|uniref:Secreted protein n=1 Tax=Pseudozyma flocculosa TaxID=84751 RepID=A0A5C3EWD1_9BASI|nr:uncharacterized protein PSFLO_01833 [Pseudozyma flocculosa]
MWRPRWVAWVGMHALCLAGVPTQARLSDRLPACLSLAQFRSALAPLLRAEVGLLTSRSSLAFFADSSLGSPPPPSPTCRHHPYDAGRFLFAPLDIVKMFAGELQPPFPSHLSRGQPLHPVYPCTMLTTLMPLSPLFTGSRCHHHSMPC